MPAREISKGERWSERDAGSGIGSAHDRLHVIPAGVEACNDPTVDVQHARLAIGDDSAGGSDIPGIDPHGIERSLRDRSKARVALGDPRVAEITIVGGAAFAKVGVL